MNLTNEYLRAIRGGIEARFQLVAVWCVAIASALPVTPFPNPRKKEKKIVEFNWMLNGII